MNASSPPLVSVVIVHFNGAELLEACLRSVEAQPYRPVEIIVVDNGSTDGSTGRVRERHPGVRLLEQKYNSGFAEGNNIGVRAAEGEYVVILNNDTEVTPSWIPGLLGALHAPGVTVATSRVVTDGVPDAYYAMNGSINALGYNIMRVFADLSTVFFAGGASLMFRRSEIPQPFPPEYFLYQEDVYLSWRVRLRGGSVKMAQESLVYHRGSATTRSQRSALVTFYQERNRLLNALALYETATLLRLFPLFLVDAGAKFLLSVIAGRKSPLGIIKAYAWCLGHPGWVARFRRIHQRERTVPDAGILCWMSSRLLEGNGRMAGIMNALARAYARVTGLHFYD